MPGTGWVHWLVVVESAGFPIGAAGAVEPQIVVDLGPLPPYERGDHVWFKTLVQNPTQWNNEGRGNDFPALYYYDPYLKTQFEMFFDMTPMSWMGPDTIKRFQGYRCGLRRVDHGHPAAEIGLLAEVQGGRRFPAGRQVFSWYTSVRHLDDGPTPPREQDALAALVSDCLALLPPVEGQWPARARSWRELAEGCAVDLMDDEHCWGSDGAGEFLRAYVDGHSDAWAAAAAARGRTYDGDGPCLEAALWALDPLDDLARSAGRRPLPATPRPAADVHHRGTASTALRDPSGASRRAAVHRHLAVRLPAGGGVEAGRRIRRPRAARSWSDARSTPSWCRWHTPWRTCSRCSSTRRR